MSLEQSLLDEQGKKRPVVDKMLEQSLLDEQGKSKVADDKRGNIKKAMTQPAPTEPCYKGNTDDTEEHPHHVTKRGSPSDILQCKKHQGKVKDLPDLTEYMKKKGIYGQYMEYKMGYSKWRQGEAIFVKGEMTVASFEKQHEKMAFDFWYPTVQQFTFRRTISFWCGVLQLQGSLLFMWDPFFQDKDLTFDLYKGDLVDSSELTYWMTKFPILAGGTLYLIGIYMGYFNFINIDTGADKLAKGSVKWFHCDVKQLVSLGCERDSFVGVFCYMFGALFYSVAQICDLFPGALSNYSVFLVEWPFLIGGFLFFIAGCSEVSINEVYCSKPNTLVWWVSAFNCLGGLCFWLSCVPSLVGEETTRIGVAGDFSYIIAASMSMKMWQSEQFGGALIPVLNAGHSHRDEAHGSDTDSKHGDMGSLFVEYDKKTGAHHIVRKSSLEDKNHKPLNQVLNPKLSFRGLLFMHVYAFIGASQIINCCHCLHQWNQAHTEHDPRKFERVTNTFLKSFVFCMFSYAILLLQSYSVHGPKKDNQPWRTLWIILRSLSVIILANSVLTLKVLFDFDYGGQHS